MKSVHAEKIGGISQDLQELRSSLPDIDKMKFGFDNSALHKGKVLFTATNINYAYHKQPLWKDNLNFQITSGERIALKGTNGSGKTTLISSWATLNRKQEQFTEQTTKRFTLVNNEFFFDNLNG